MTRLKLTALMFGATALTIPLGTSAYAQTQVQTQGQAAVAVQGQEQELGACELLLRLIDEAQAAQEEILEDFRESAEIASSQNADECALVIREVEAAGGISRQAVAEGRGIQYVTETETFRATDTVTETVEIDRRAIVEGEVLVRQPIPEVEIEQGQAEVQVRERPGRISVDEEPASVEIRQAAANVRVAVPRPTVTIEQPAPEIIITMPAPGLTVERDQPQVDVVMAEPTVTVTQADPEVSVNVDARLVDADVAMVESEEPRVVTRAQRVSASGQDATQEDAEVAVRKVKPSIRFVTADVQDEVQFNRATPRITYQAAEPNVEVTFNEEPRVEIRQTGEPRVRVRREGDDQSMLQGGQQNQRAQAGQRQQQATVMQGQATAQQGQATTQQGENQQFAAEVVRAEDAVIEVERGVQSATQALEMQDFETARVELDRANQRIGMAMQQADAQQRQQLQGLSDQIGIVLVDLEEQDMRGARTGLTDVQANLDQNREYWGLDRVERGLERTGTAIERTAEGAANTVGQGVAAIGSGIQQGAREVEREVTSGARLSLEDTNRLLAAEEGYETSQAERMSVTAGDLNGADVYTMRGEEVGEVEQIAAAGGRLYAIISHGGFLGIGENEVAIPLERLAMRGNEVVLLGLTEEQLEQMPNYDFAADQEYSATEPVEIGRFE